MESPALAAADKRVERRTAWIVAWLLCLAFYFLTYALRSAPGVMIPQLSAAFGLATLGISTLVGLYYYTYAGFAIIAGGALDRYGARFPVTLGIVAVAAGSVLFPLSASGLVGAGAGRLLQGAGAAFAFTGAVYLATRGFSSRWLATVIGFTQAAGLLGGSAGQFAVGPLVQGPITWQGFWIYIGGGFVVIAILFVLITPSSGRPASGSFWGTFTPYRTILTNPQSYLCGIIAGLLFMPTTIGDMIWGVPFLRQGLGVEAAEAIARSSMIPLGWVIGAPLLGYLADLLQRRKLVLVGGIVLMLLSGAGAVYLHEYLPPYVGGLLFGVGSGAAMIPYTMIKEVNPDDVKASTAGAMNFLVFTFSAFLGPVFGLALQRLSQNQPLMLSTFHQADLIWVGAIVLALILTAFLRETGTALTPSRKTPSASQQSER